LSTRFFNFPNEAAAKIAIETVSSSLKNTSLEKVIINVFTDKDQEIYRKLLYG